MTNKEFQEILKQYPDDLPVYIDVGHGWNAPSNENQRDPSVSVQNDEGGYPWGLEIWAGEYPVMDEETIRKVFECAGDTWRAKSSGIVAQTAKLFSETYE